MNGFDSKAQNATRTGVPIIPVFVLSLLAMSLVAGADVPNKLETNDSTSPTARGDWVQEGFDPGHTSFNRFETELSPENVGNLVELWESPVGGGTLFCGPVVRDGKVYIGSSDGNMYAFDAGTGATEWVGESQGILFSATAAVGHGLVFDSAFNRPFLAYNAETGEIAWNSGFSGVQAAPTLQGQRLYFFSADDVLHALDQETGMEIWSAETEGSTQSQAAVVLDGRVFQIRGSGVLGGLTAFDAQTGEILWHKIEAGSGSGAVAVRGRLFFRGVVERGGESVVAALDAATGELIWETPTLPGGTDAVPAVAYGMVFVTFVDLFALDAKTGVEVWRVPGVHSVAGPSVANGVVYASNLSGEWDAFDARNGALLWSVVVGAGCGGTCTNAIPVVANGRLYLAGPDQFLRAYGLPR